MMNKLIHPTKALPVLAMTAGVLAVYPRLVCRRYRILSRRIHTPFRLAVLSDLHASWYGAGQTELLRRLVKEQPDGVLLAGDMGPDWRPADNLRELLTSLSNRYPIFYVSGNHEIRSGRSRSVKTLMLEFGVSVLEGNTRILRKGMDRIQICGVDDPEVDFFFSGSSWMQQLHSCSDAREEEIFSVLLSHRPELFSFYAKENFDLVVCGHAHGGQVRIPGLLNGLYAPNQGFFPSHAGGFYRKGNTAMIVSRGLAKNCIPRVCNPPEFLVIDILPAPERMFLAQRTGEAEDSLL